MARPTVWRHPMSVISLSTCWNSPRHTDGYEMIAEIAALGFEHVELSHGIRLSLVPGIVRALEEKLVTVTSTHNFCPLPPGVNSAAPNLFIPSSDDARITMQWDRYTRRSIEFARQVGARLVVAHLGAVEFGWFNPARAVNNALKGHDGTRAGELERLRTAAAACVAKAKKLKDEPWARVQKMLEPVLKTATSHGIMIGAENREKCEELPFESDVAGLLTKFPAGSGLAYWHDTGHAHLKEKMGLVRHEELLQAHVDRLAGFHIHDVRGFTDHLPPGTGEIDFRMVSRYMRPHHILVLELNPRLNPPDIVEAREFIERVIGVAA